MELVATVQEQDVQDWLDQYGGAWASGDPDHVATLFTEGAFYRETPFDEPMRERHEIREYWQKGAADAQENVEFTSQVWAVRNDTAIAHWQARFNRKASGVQVELDGVFRLTFSNERGVLRCTVLEEWWHSKQS